jgi:cytochrome c
MRNAILSSILFSSLAFAAAPAEAPAAKAAGPALDGAKLYATKTCLACHGKDAKTPILPEYPRLAGPSALYAERQMKDIKSGARANGNTAAMKGIMPLVNDDEIHALAEFISTLK